MRYCKCLIIFIIAFLPAKLFAQPASSADRDITGLWKGTLYNDSTKKYYRYEIGISEEKGKLSGFSHTFFLVGDKEFYGVKKVKIKKTGDKIIVEDAGLIANNYPEAPAKGVRQLNVLTLDTRDSIMTLSGPFSTNRTKEYSSLTGTINLQRKNDFWQSALVPHLQELGLSNNLSFVKKENDLAKAKEEADKIAAQKDLLAKNDLQEPKKEKTIIETPVKKEEAKVETKTSEPSKEMAAKATTSKVVASKEIKPNETKQVEPSKEIAANTNNSKTETNKEIKIDEPKSVNSSSANDLAVNTTVPKTESNKEIKTDKPNTVNTAASKETALNTNDSKTALNKEQKPNEVKPVTSSNKTIVNTGAKETKVVAVKIIPPAAEVESRTNIIQQTVYFSSDSLQLSLYDNGEVDGDTVSVLMNGKVIMPKEGLSTNAVNKTIYAGNISDSIKLVMYAENLGSIPPNTGLLVVHDGKSIYEIRFSGDLKKNASIILRRRKN